MITVPGAKLANEEKIFNLFSYWIKQIPITLTVGQCYNNFTSQWFLAYSNSCSIINSFNQTFFPGLWSVLVSINYQPDIAYRHLRVKPYPENRLDQTNGWASLLSVEDCPDWCRRAQPTISSTWDKWVVSCYVRKVAKYEPVSKLENKPLQRFLHDSSQPSIFLNDGLWLGNVRQIILSHPP